MKLKNVTLIGIACLLYLTSCVSKKLLQNEQLRYVQLQSEQTKLQEALKNCNDLATENARKTAVLESELQSTKKTK